MWRAVAIVGLAAALDSPVAAATGASDRWPDFQIMVWQPQSQAAYKGLKQLGVTAGALVANREAPGADLQARIAPFREAGLRWYVENIATDFYAPYHRYVAGQPVNAMFLQAQQRWRLDPADPRAFERVPSLSDDAWIARVQERLRRTVRAQNFGRPLFYDLGDETGIADLTAAWDFDRSPASFAAMREWLLSRYGSLAALNAQWGTAFASWGEVVPDSTADALARRDDNFSSWVDFKDWMDEAFARAIRAGTDAVHAADPVALAAIEGAQRPGMGGYDYARLAGSVDVMEIYPDEDNLDIVRALNPRLVLLTTSFAQDSASQRAVWQAVLRGARGLVLWDEEHDFVLPDGRIGPRGSQAAALLAELRGPATAALLASDAIYDDIAIVYAPASDRVQWLLDRRRSAGDVTREWSGRDADVENEDTPIRRSRRIMSSALLHHGLRPRWITPEQVVSGALSVNTRVLLLPQTVALSEAAVRAIEQFAAAGGRVIADGTPAQWDEHGRHRAVPPLGALTAPTLPPDWMARIADVGVIPRVTLQPHPGDVEIRISQDGRTQVVSLLSAVTHDVNVTIEFARAGEIEDLRTRTRLNPDRGLQLTLDPFTPTLLRFEPRG